MKFDTYLPAAVLAPYIHSLVISESDESHTYKVLPGTGLVIGFQYRGHLSYLDNDTEVALSSSGITGLQDHFRLFKNTPHIGTVLVFFKEGGAAHFFNTPIHELFGESISLDNFILRSTLLLLEEQLAEAGTDTKRIQVVENFLASRMRQVQPDQLVLSAITLIYQRKGNIRITDLMQQLHISQSPLEKRFRQVIGASPKKFAGIVRMKHAIQQHRPDTSLTSLGYETGFYDQAHFIKEFKKFTGDTPDNFFTKE